MSKLKELDVDPSKVDVDKLLLLIEEESLKRKSLISESVPSCALVFFL